MRSMLSVMLFWLIYKRELKRILKLKLKIEEEVEAFASFNSDRIKEWNQKTKEILELQKRWDAVGGVPRAKQKTLTRNSGQPLKAFFHNKNQFFKKLDEERIRT
jgi:hypothetical protein